MSPAEQAAADAEAQVTLDRIGYSGDAKTYRARLREIDDQRRRGVGPGAWLDRYLAQCARRFRRAGR